jgi:hypothetical protein
MLAASSRAVSVIRGQSSTAMRSSPRTRSRSSRSTSSSAPSVWRSISMWITDSGAPSSEWAGSTRCSSPSASRMTRMTGWTKRWMPYSRRLTAIPSESTRNGMSSLTTSTTVCVDCQPCCSKAGL